MPLVVPKKRYLDGERVVALRTQTMYGFMAAHVTATLALCTVITERKYTVLETHYGQRVKLNGARWRLDLRDTEDWAVEDSNVEVIGVVFGRLDLDDHVAITQYLSRVLDVIWDDMRAGWFWRATDKTF